MSKIGAYTLPNVHSKFSSHHSLLDLLQGPRRPGVFGVGRSVSEVSCLKADQPDGELHGQLQLRGADVRRERSAVGPPADHRARGGV